METWKWIIGLVLPTLIGGIGGYFINKNKKHKATHKRIYDKLDELERTKANTAYVDDRMKELSDNINDRTNAYMRETESAYNSIICIVQEQGKRIDSIDKKLDLIINKLE